MSCHTPVTVREKKDMASIRKRGNKYQVQVRREGCKPMVKTFTKRADALEWSKLMEVKADRRDLPTSIKSLDRVSVADIIERYIAEVCIHKKCYATESITLKAFTKTKTAKIKLSCILPADFYAYREERIKKVKPSSINRELCVIKNAFNIAIHEWAIPLKTNPLQNIKKFKVNNARNRRITDEEIQSLYEAVSQHQNPLVMTIFEIALETAMRRGEILNIRWKNINFANKTLHIPLTKNGYERTIPLTEKSIKVLSLANSDSEKLFSISPNALRLAWVRLTKRASINDLRFHDIRHEAISRFFEKGLSIPEVSLISGHRSYAMLARYTHLRAEDLVGKI